MKDKKRNIKLLSIIIFILSIGPISWIVYGNDTKDVDYSIQEEFVEEGTKAKLILEIVPSDKVTEISRIVLPDQSILENKTSIEYEVVENGEYKFVVQYKILEEDEKQEVKEIEKEEVIIFKEENIQTKKEESEESQVIEEITKEPIQERSKEENTPLPLTSGDIPIDEEHFPDANFRNYLLTDTESYYTNGYGNDGVFTFEELESIRALIPAGMNISSLKGIEYFTNLGQLYAPMNQLAEINVSNNKNLWLLDVHTNRLNAIDLSENPNIRYLNIHHNQLLSVDVSKNTISTWDAISQTREIPMIYSNGAWRSDPNVNYRITSLDNTNMTYNSSTGQITSASIYNTSSNFTTNCIDKSGETKQISGTLTFTYRGIPIDEEHFPDANFRNYLLNDNHPYYAKGYGNDGGFTPEELESIYALVPANINVSSLKGIEYFTNLEDLSASLNQLKEIDISKNTKLKRLDIQTNQIQSLDISNNPNISGLHIHHNKLLNVELSKNRITTWEGFSQTREIPMTYSNGAWRSDPNINYGITSIDNANISYNSATGQFTSSSIKNTSSNFATNCVDNSGAISQLSGTLTFIYNDIVPISNITGVPTAINAGATVVLNGTIVPDNATTTKNISWSVKDAGTTKASLNGSSLVTSASGTIVVTASVAEGTASGDAYTKDFSITVNYVSPSSLNCSLDGTIGKNGWYTSNVTVYPPSGYQISKTLGSGYTTSVIYDASTTPIIYLRQISTGSLYHAKALSDIKIDKIDPEISGILDGGSEINSSNKTVTVKDINLSSVQLFTANTLEGLSTATGVEQTITNGSSNVILQADTKDQYFKIIGEDASGRTVNYTYTIIAPTFGVHVEDITYDALTYGYNQSEGKRLNIDLQANGANSKADITSIVSSNSTICTVSGSKTDWIVIPVVGLSAKTYTVTLTTTYTGGRTTTSTVNIIVNKANNPFTITQEDISYGGILNPTIRNIKEGASLTYYYKALSLGDDAYTSIVPTLPGNYNIKAISSETDNYKETEYVTSFFIQYQLTASNACITIEEAKGIASANDLKTYNQANSNPTGIGDQIIVSCTNLAAIQSGTPGNYEVQYTVLDITTTVKIQVVENGYVISKDRQTGFYGKDIKLPKGEASTITKENILDKMKVNVITAIGTLYQDIDKFSVDIDRVHNANVGNISIVISFKEGNINITREVNVEILDDNPSAMISLPASIQLEKVLHDETFEAIKQESVNILSSTDTDVFTKNFYIYAKDSFHIMNTKHNDEYFIVQIYDENNNKYTSKDVPLAILNSTAISKKFFIKAYKGKVNNGIYKGIMDFEIRYGEVQ